MAAVALVLVMMPTASAVDTGTLRITALHAVTGLPMPGVEVWVESDGVEVALEGLTNGNGVATITNVPVGTHDVHGYYYDGEQDFSADAEVSVPTAGSTTDVSLEMVASGAEPATGIKVWVADDDGRAVVGALVTLIDGSGVVHASQSIDDSGYVLFADVVETTYTVTATLGMLSDEEVVFWEGDLRNVDLQLRQPGIGVYIHDQTFGHAVDGAEVTLTRGGTSIDTQVSDETGFVKFSDIGAGGHHLTVTKEGFDSSAAQEISYVAGTYHEVYVELLADFACEPNSVQAHGLTNVGFEDGWDGWTPGHEVEGSALTSADDFTAPLQGASMLRMGSSPPSGDGTQLPGPNVVCQDFVVDQEVETFAYNVFTYDLTGADEFRFDVAISGEDGERLESFTKTAWGTSTDLKSTGWQTVTIDLTGLVGETVRITLRSGGAVSDLHPFWTYLDSAPPLAQGPSGPTPACLAAQAERGSAQAVLSAANVSVSTAGAKAATAKAKLKKARKSGNAAKIKKAKAKYKKARSALVAANAVAGSASAAVSAAQTKVSAHC